MLQLACEVYALGALSCAHDEYAQATRAHLQLILEWCDFIVHIV